MSWYSVVLIWLLFSSVGRRRKKLILFLEHQPRCYEPEALLKQFPSDELYQVSQACSATPLCCSQSVSLEQEQAILLRAVGAHEQALSIYVHHLHDDKLAER